MNHRILLATLLLFLLSACSDPTPVGEWDLDLSATTAQIEKAMQERMGEMSEDERKQAEAMVKPMMDMMTKMKAHLEIRPDHTFVIDSESPMQGTDHLEGQWSLEGDQLTLTGKSAQSGEESAIVGTWKGDEIVVEMGDAGQPMTMHFRRDTAG